MKNYCPHCDQFTEFVYDKCMYWCTTCHSGRSHLPEPPPAERNITFLCNSCGLQTFSWAKNHFPSRHKGYDYFNCSKCGGQYCLQIDAKKRQKELNWRLKGCPPHWYNFLIPYVILFIFLLFFISLWFYPTATVIGYFVFCYAIGITSMDDGWFFSPIFVTYYLYYWCFIVSLMFIASHFLWLYEKTRQMLK